MIEINLLPGARKKKGSSSRSSLNVGAAFGDLASKLKDPWLAVAIGGVVIGVAAAVLLAAFDLAFPYYRQFLKDSIGLFSDVTDLHTSESIHLTFMPYVSLSALILATPRRTMKEKAKVVARKVRRRWL